jgi:phage protein D
MDARFEIKVNGTAVQEIENDVAEIIVDSTIGVPSMFHIILEDWPPNTEQFKYLDSKTFKLGNEIEIIGKVKNITNSLIKGEITAIEPDFNAHGSVLVHIRGYDKSYKLSQGKKTRTFLKKTISDIVKTMAGECGLSADVDATTFVYDQQFQLNQSNWDFIQSRAELVGYMVYSQEGKLCFKKPTLNQGSVQLNWGDNLSSFRPKVSILGQKSKATASGWDVKKKQAIVSTAGPAGASFHAVGEGRTGGSTEKTVVGGDVIDNTIDIPFRTVDESKVAADASILESESLFIQAEGECVEGNPNLLAGTIIEIKDVGTTFSGKYFITEARHEFSHGQYRVWFSNHGFAPETISGLVSTGETNDGFARIYGVVPAVVTNNDSSQTDLDAGCVKLKFPWMPKSSDAEVESDWARVASIGLGAQRGIYFMPEVNDEVLVAFEQGDIHHPYVLGGLLNGKDKPIEGVKNVVSQGKVNLRMIKTRSGHEILLDDTEGSEKISIIDKTKNNSIVIDSKQNTITIKSDKDMVFDAAGKMTFTCKGDFAVNATGAVNMDSKSSVKVTGMSAINVKSNQAVTVENAAGNKLDLSPAGATLQGLTTSIKGNMMVEIKGAVVQIN